MFIVTEYAALRDANICSFFNTLRGHNYIVCRSNYAIFCTRMDLTKIFVMPLDFAVVKNNVNMSKGKAYRMH